MANYERSGNLSIWWFPRDFSQSRFGEYRQSGTNSCTLISLILANKVSREEHGFLRAPNELPRRAFGLFSAAINDGNAAYSRAFGTVNHAVVPKPNRHNLSIPDAMQMLRSQSSVGFHLQEWFYTHLHSDRNKDNYFPALAAQLTQIFSVGIQLFRHTLSKGTIDYLFAAVIADSRTVCFIFEFPANLVSVFDSHQHGRQAGALIAQASLSHLFELVLWFIRMQYDIYSSQPQLYEVSFLTTAYLALPTQRKLESKFNRNR